MEEFIVSILEDENDGDFSAGDLSLREAIATAESGDTITFDSNLSGGTINLVDGELALDKSLTINGLGAENIIIDAGGNSRVFNIDDGNEDTQLDVALNSLSITGSESEFDITNNDDVSFNYGGGIFNSENLEVNNANIYDNQTAFRGGGIYSEGTLTVNNSEIYSNSVGDGEDRTTAGGGIYSEGILTVNNSAIYSNSGFGSFGIATGGGITNAGTATIDQSTISDNGVGGRLNSGGGIENREGNLTITNSTISDNSSNLTGGILNNAGEVTVTSTIIANVGNQNISGDDFISGGNNFISGEAEVSSRGGPIIISAEGFTDGENGDIVGTLENPIDPLLGELQDNGGSTPTQALLEGSPAIDAGSNPNNLEFDQRGEGFDRVRGENIDIGAFEVQSGDGGGNPVELVVSTLEDEIDGDFSEGDLSLREAIANAESGSSITFDSSLSGGSIVLNSGELSIDKSLFISGLGANNLTISGNNESRVFLIDDGDTNNQATVSISELTIADGNTGDGSPPDINGGGIFNQENLLLFNSAVTNNDAGNGAAIFNNSGSRIEVQNSLISNNSSLTAAISNDDGSALILNTTIANNNSGGIGAIVNDGGGELELVNSTVADNNGFDAAVFNGEDSKFTVRSSIIADNTGDIEPGQDNVIGTFISEGNNLIGNSNGGTGFDSDSDLVGTADNPIDPLLGELQDNGGLTQTIALQEGSPAIDTGSNFFNSSTDQRGEGFDRTVGDGTDIGAFELQTTDPGDGSDNQDNDNTIATANDSGISPDGQQNVVLNDAIAFNSDVDLFRLNLEAADVATFNIEAVEFGSSLDSVLRVFDSEGNELAFDDDGNAPFEDASLDSYLEFTPEADGEYYVGVSSFSNFDYDPVNGGNSEGFSSGDYDLALSVFDGIDGTEGADNLSGGDESDFVRGLGGNDTLAGNGDKDNLLGGSGNDVLTGGDGDDLLQGGDGFDVLRGGNGNDTLGGGTGQNNLYGGQGNDIFAIGEGEDTVFDFQDGSDKLLLTGSLDFVAFEDLSISASDTGTTIGTSDTTFATLTGISPDQITADDLVSPNFLAATFIANDTAAIEAKAV